MTSPKKPEWFELTQTDRIDPRSSVQQIQPTIAIPPTGGGDDEDENDEEEDD